MDITSPTGEVMTGEPEATPEDKAPPPMDTDEGKDMVHPMAIPVQLDQVSGGH